MWLCVRALYSVNCLVSSSLWLLSHHLWRFVRDISAPLLKSILFVWLAMLPKQLSSEKCVHNRTSPRKEGPRPIVLSLNCEKLFVLTNKIICLVLLLFGDKSQPIIPRRDAKSAEWDRHKERGRERRPKKTHTPNCNNLIDKVYPFIVCGLFDG